MRLYSSRRKKKLQLIEDELKLEVKKNELEKINS